MIEHGANNPKVATLRAFERRVAEAFNAGKKFYVYEHWRPDLNVPFYVGKGHGRRAYRMTDRPQSHNKVVQSLNKRGLKMQIKIYGNLTEKRAFAFEKKLIAFWRNKGVLLLNQSNGGQGSSGFIYPDWLRRLRSKHMRTAWQRPGARARRSQIAKLAHANSDNKLRHRIGCKRGQGTATQRLRISQRMKLLCKDQKFMQCRNTKLRKTLALPEVKNKKKAIRLKIISRPGFVEKNRQAIRQAMKRPEVKMKLGKHSLGSKWINNSIENKRLRCGKQLPAGWFYGKRAA